MIKFNKENNYLICADSDGTVMDTMTIKHVRCFGPCFIEAFGITTHVDEILTKWNDDNLYTLTRGINRFQGLDKILEYVKQFGYEYNGYNEFHNWVTTTGEFSVKSIEKYMLTCEVVDCFDLALVWSKLVNENIEALPPSKYFDGVKDTLLLASKKADLVGVSSANPQAVMAEWTSLGIAPLFKEIACQDKGNKTQIIKESLLMGYDKKNVIMVGDAIGDLKAAQNNGVWFFPIIPKHEVECWKKFKEETLDVFTSGKFDENYQESLLKEFYSILEKGE